LPEADDHEAVRRRTGRQADLLAHAVHRDADGGVERDLGDDRELLADDVAGDLAFDVVHADPEELLVAEAADDVEARLEVGRGVEPRRELGARSSRERVSRTRSARTRLSSSSGWRRKSRDRNSLVPKSRTRSRITPGFSSRRCRKLVRAPIDATKLAM
jgi:hypothetical protein